LVQLRSGFYLPYKSQWRPRALEFSPRRFRNSATLLYVAFGIFGIRIAPLATALKASGDPVIKGILTSLRQGISRSGATLSPGVQVVNQRGACRVDINAFYAVRALPRLRPRRRKGYLPRLRSTIRGLSTMALTTPASAISAQPRRDLEALRRLPRFTAHAILRVHSILACHIDPLLARSPDRNCTARQKS